MDKMTFKEFLNENLLGLLGRSERQHHPRRWTAHFTIKPDAPSMYGSVEPVKVTAITKREAIKKAWAALRLPEEDMKYFSLHSIT